MCALSETKLKGKGEVMLGEVVGRARCRAREGVAPTMGGPVTEWAIDEVFSRMEGDVIQAYVG